MLKKGRIQIVLLIFQLITALHVLALKLIEK